MIPCFFQFQVKYSMFTSGLEVAYVVFDGKGTTKNDWFDSTTILFSSYTNLASTIGTASNSYCSIAGYVLCVKYKILATACFSTY